MREIDPHALTPELAAAARRAQENVWPGEREHTLLPAAGQVAPQGGAARTEFFSRLRIPMQSGTGDPKKAWPNGMPPEMAARRDAIMEDVVRRQRAAKRDAS